MKDITVSVIIAIYNMEQWIGQAIETVERQTLNGIELICVDDGSTDKSLEILNSYKKQYNNLTILHQENKGAGPARNLGIDSAHGEYIAFLDADDYYYSEDALEYLYEKAKEYSAMICRGSSCDDRNGVLSYKGLRPERIFIEDGFLFKKDFPGPTGYWAGIYNRRFLLENRIRFPDLLRGQDGVFSTQAIAYAGKVYCLKRIVYVYRKEHKTVLYTGRKAIDAIRTMEIILQISSENGLKRIFEAWKRELFGEQSSILYKYAAAGNKEMLKLASELNKLIGGGLYEGDEIKAYIEKVEREKERFLTHLKEQEKVYIFGAGTIGRKVITYLLEHHISISAIIVSDIRQNPEEIDGISVKSIDQIQTNQSYEVIIATFKYSQDAIMKVLLDHGINRVIPLDLCAFYLWQDEIKH